MVSLVRWMADPAGASADLEALLRQGDRTDALLVALALALFWALLVIRRRSNEALLRAAVASAFDGDEEPLERWRAHDSAWEPFTNLLLDRISRVRGEATAADGRAAEAAGRGDHLHRRYAQVPVPVFLVDEGSRVVEANREACRLFGRNREELVGHDLHDLFRRRSGREDLDWLEGLLPLGLHGEAGMEVVRMDGTTVPVVSWSRPLDAAEGGSSFEQYVAIDVGRLRHPHGDRDVDERHQQDQILESMGRLAAGVAHDFNDHLTAILGHGLILREQTKESPELSSHAAEVCDAAESARQITKELLTFSRTQVAYPELIALNEVVTALRHEVERAAGRGVRVAMRLDEGLEKVRMDRAQLEEIVMKLVDHARQSMRGEGQLVVETSRVPDSSEWVALRVADTGRGMDADARTHAFEPYYTTNQGEFGSGMGLAPVHGAVAQNGGRVLISSDVGRGTSVELRFPVSANGRPEAETRRGQGAGGRPTVCVIEDDTQVRRLITSVLEREGFRVLTAADGGEGLELCTRRGDEIDLVLADVNMPNLNGPQLAAELKRQHPELSVLFMSGYVDEESFDALRAGADGFLQKPFTPGELTQTVRGAVRGRSRRAGIVRVLVVDDEEPVRNMLRTLLRGLGYECTAVGDGDAALQELERSWYDVVITDMIMPDKDGIVICSEIHRRFPDVRIIAMSGRAGGTAGLSAALEFGAVSTLSKPFSMDELELALNLATT